MSRPVVIVGTGEGRCVLEACRAIARPVAGFLDLDDARYLASVDRPVARQ